jgi:hypothetical protein
VESDLANADYWYNLEIRKLARNQLRKHSINNAVNFILLYYCVRVASEFTEHYAKD